MTCPDFLVAGAAKSGTTSLYYYLRQHPRIYMPDLKEPSFFAFAGMEADAARFPHLPIVHGADRYLDLFAGASAAQLRGEASTVYLYRHEQTIRNIKRLRAGWNDIRIVIVLRNPVERAYSHYMNHVRDGSGEESFEDALDLWRSGNAAPQADYIGYGMYHRQVKAYLDAFSHVHVILSEDLRGETEQTMGEVFGFLGLPPAPRADFQTRLNSSGAPRSKAVSSLVRRGPLAAMAKRLLPFTWRLRAKEWLARKTLKAGALSAPLRAELSAVYEEDVRSLERLLGRDLGRWRAAR